MSDMKCGIVVDTMLHCMLHAHDFGYWISTGVKEFHFPMQQRASSSQLLVGIQVINNSK